MSPIRSRSLRSLSALGARRLELVESRDDRIDRNPSVRDQLCAVLAQRGCKWRGPGVLVDEDRSRGARLESCTGLVVVVLPEHPRRRTLELGQVELAIGVEVADRQAGHRAVLVFAHECEVEYADDAAVGEVDERLQTLAVRLLAARPLDDQIVDRAQLDVAVVHSLPPRVVAVFDPLVCRDGSRRVSVSATSGAMSLSPPPRRPPVALSSTKPAPLLWLFWTDRSARQRWFRAHRERVRMRSGIAVLGPFGPFGARRRGSSTRASG